MTHRHFSFKPLGHIFRRRWRHFLSSLLVLVIEASLGSNLSFASSCDDVRDWSANRGVKAIFAPKTLEREPLMAELEAFLAKKSGDIVHLTPLTGGLTTDSVYALSGSRAGIVKIFSRVDVGENEIWALDYWQALKIPQFTQIQLRSRFNIAMPARAPALGIVMSRAAGKTLEEWIKGGGTQPVNDQTMGPTLDRLAQGMVRFHSSLPLTELNARGLDGIASRTLQGFTNTMKSNGQSVALFLGKKAVDTIIDIVKNRLTDILGEREGQQPLPGGVAHCDFHARNVITDGQSIAIIDLGSTLFSVDLIGGLPKANGESSPLRDVFRFAASFMVFAEVRMANDDMTPTQVTQFREVARRLSERFVAAYLSSWNSLHSGWPLTINRSVHRDRLATLERLDRINFLRLAIQTEPDQKVAKVLADLLRVEIDRLERFTQPAVH